jgi:hypothetical protein
MEKQRISPSSGMIIGGFCGIGVVVLNYFFVLAMYGSGDYGASFVTMLFVLAIVGACVGLYVAYVLNGHYSSRVQDINEAIRKEGKYVHHLNDDVFKQMLQDGSSQFKTGSIAEYIIYGAFMGLLTGALAAICLYMFVSNNFNALNDMIEHSFMTYAILGAIATAIAMACYNKEVNKINYEVDEIYKEKLTAERERKLFEEMQRAHSEKMLPNNNLARNLNALEQRKNIADSMIKLAMLLNSKNGYDMQQLADQFIEHQARK